MFLSTEAWTSQWESSVFVSLTKAPALMILDEYGAEDRGWVSDSVLGGIALPHRSYLQKPGVGHERPRTDQYSPSPVVRRKKKSPTMVCPVRCTSRGTLVPSGKTICPAMVRYARMIRGS